MAKSQYEYAPLYYNGPTQLRYFDTTIQDYRYGIGYHDFIIRAEDGNVISIPKIMELGIAEGMPFDNVIIEYGWRKLQF